MKTILIVDDEFGIVDALTDLLMEEGYKVMTASNGKLGLSQLQSAAPDLVLLDIMMPVLSGRGMLDALRALPAPHANTPVIMMSAIPQAVAFPRDEHSPAYEGYLRKPFSLQDVLAVIAQCLAQAESR